MNKIEKICTLEQFLVVLKLNNNLINPTARALGVGASTVIRYCDIHDIHLPTKGLKTFSSKYTGVDNTRAKNTYNKMLDRCYNPRNKNYDRYGGRGIIVCDHWRDSVLNFFNDLKNLPNAFCDGYTLDRIDNDGNYEISNVRFATKKEQANNTSHNVVFILDGERYTMSQLAEKIGVTGDFIKDRVRLGFTLEEIINIPVGEKRFKPVVNIIKRGKGKLSLRIKPDRETNIERMYYYYTPSHFDEVFDKVVVDLRLLCEKYGIILESHLDVEVCRKKF